MKLEEITKDFAKQRGIYLAWHRSRMIGYHDPLFVGYRNHGKKETFHVQKEFPPFSKTIESDILFVTQSGNEGILSVSIIYGCLTDYLALLPEDGLGKALHKALFPYLSKNKDLLSSVRNRFIGVTTDHLATLLPCFYPVPYSTSKII